MSKTSSGNRKEGRINEAKDLLADKEVLAEDEAYNLIRLYGIPIPEYGAIKERRDKKALQKFIRKNDLKFPVVLKICSEEILHKTDVGGVKLGIKDLSELLESVKEFQSKFGGKKLLVEEMMDSDVELIAGLTRDPSFGLRIMVGIGGIFTELYKDVSYRVVPISKRDAKQMLSELKGRRIFEGFRNIKIDRDSVLGLLVKLSNLGAELEEHIQELDLNPVLPSEQGVCVADASVIIGD